MVCGREARTKETPVLDIYFTCRWCTRQRMKPRGNHRIDPVTPYPRARNSSICSRGAIRGPIKTIPPTGPLLPTLSLHRIILGVRQGNRFNPFPREKRLISHGRNYHTYGKKRINRVNQLCASTSITQRVFFALRIIRNGNNNNNNNNMGAKWWRGNEVPLCAFYTCDGLKFVPYVVPLLKRVNWMAILMFPR